MFTWEQFDAVATTFPGTVGGVVSATGVVVAQAEAELLDTLPRPSMAATV
jgi:hypothetical protein